MKTVYEKHSEKIISGDKIKTIKEVDEKEATHKHICYHDEADDMGRCKPCKRVKL